MFFSLFQDDRLHQRFGITEGDDGQHVPPLPPRTSYERTVTVVRGNRSLGMFSMFLVVMVSWCVYIVGMAVMTLLGSGDYNYHEDKWWRDVFLKTERRWSLCVGVCVFLKLLPTKNAHSTRKVRRILRNEDIFVGSSQFQRAVWELRCGFKVGTLHSFIFLSSCCHLPLIRQIPAPWIHY